MRILHWILSKPAILVGGQAVIEGVMMRVPCAYATAVRDPQGEIKIDRHEFRSLGDRKPIWKKPVLRGVAALFESMKIGFGTLQWSADVALPEEEKGKEPGKLGNFLSILFAVVLALLLFMIGPMWITTWLLDIEKEALFFNLVSGAFRITFFILYLVIISLLKDVRRLFKYHGAEHRVVYNFESGQPINTATAQSFPTQHPRCGTSFLFVVLISAILIFAVIDTIVISLIGTITLGIRLLVHLPLIPLVMGLSYEVIKISARNGHRLLFRMLRAPGLWLQRITTKQPEDEMVEVAIAALKAAFGDRYEEMVGKKYTAEAIA